jgi:hypothetical protein
MTSGEIETWRSEHQARVRERHQAAAQAAGGANGARELVVRCLGVRYVSCRDNLIPLCWLLGPSVQKF